MHTTQYAFDIHATMIGGAFIRDYDSMIQAWTEAPSILSSYQFLLDEGLVQVVADWNKAAEYELKNLALSIEENGSVALPEDIGPLTPFRIGCTVTLPDSTSDPKYYLARYIYDVFLAMNLSSPGCCDFFDAKIIDGDGKGDISFKLSSGIIGGAFDISQKNNWPPITPLPLVDTWNWVRAIMHRPKDIAGTRLERAIFAAFHIARHYSIDPTSIIWLAHALESLFDTPHVTISQILRERIFLVLGKPESNHKQAKRGIDEFYNLRSRFIHGDLPTTHPTSAFRVVESEQVEDLMDEILNLTDFAMSIIWSTFQLCVRNSWYEIEFVERFNGLVISSANSDTDLESRSLN